MDPLVAIFLNDFTVTLGPVASTEFGSHICPSQKPHNRIPSTAG